MKKLLLLLLCVPLMGLTQNFENYSLKGDEDRLKGQWEKSIHNFTLAIQELEKINSKLVTYEGEKINRDKLLGIFYFRKGQSTLSLTEQLGKEYYSSRLGFFWYSEKLLNQAVSDFTKSINLYDKYFIDDGRPDSGFYPGFVKRGDARKLLDAGKGTINFCNDYKKGCDFDKEDNYIGCKKYYTDCK